MSVTNKTYVDVYNGDESIPMFITFVIEQFKNAKGISGAEAAQILAQAGVLAHLEEYYDVLHTQSAQWLIAEVSEMVDNFNSKR